MHSWPLDFNTHFFCWFIVRVLNSNVVAQKNVGSALTFGRFQSLFCRCTSIFCGNSNFYIAMVENSLKYCNSFLYLFIALVEKMINSSSSDFLPRTLTQVFPVCDPRTRLWYGDFMVIWCWFEWDFWMGFLLMGFSVRNWCSFFLRRVNHDFP